jgi:hypothetical protein
MALTPTPWNCMRPSSHPSNGALGLIKPRASAPGSWALSAAGGGRPGILRHEPYLAFLHSITAKKGEDGLIAIQLGGCDGKIANCLPTMPGWSYMVRLYRPRAEILNGTWKFPDAR